MIDKNPDSPKFLDKDEPCFPELRRSCDNMNRDLRTRYAMLLLSRPKKGDAAACIDD